MSNGLVFLIFILMVAGFITILLRGSNHKENVYEQIEPSFVEKPIRFYDAEHAARIRMHGYYRSRKQQRRRVVENEYDRMKGRVWFELKFKALFLFWLFVAIFFVCILGWLGIIH